MEKEIRRIYAYANSTKRISDLPWKKDMECWFAAQTQVVKVAFLQSNGWPTAGYEKEINRRCVMYTEFVMKEKCRDSDHKQTDKAWIRENKVWR